MSAIIFDPVPGERARLGLGDEVSPDADVVTHIFGTGGIDDLSDHTVAELERGGARLHSRKELSDVAAGLAVTRTAEVAA